MSQVAAPIAAVRPGKHAPLGAHWTGQGVNFAIFAQNAEKVELCLFARAEDPQPARTVDLGQKTRNVWHCLLPECRPGQLYGYRVYGPYQPCRGRRFNPAKLLLDPYARAITNKVDWSRGSPLSYDPASAEKDLVPDTSDDAAAMPKCVVVDHRFDWDGDQPLRTPLARSVIYELHIKGFTCCFPGLEPKLRGTYAGLASPEVLGYLTKLGITAVELLPVHECQPEKFLLDRGLTNYWGYNTAGFFAPDGRYSASGTLGGQVNEFKQMVKRLHRAGLEVILDVVYNHTAEGDHLGPTLSWRGIDNEVYYWLADGDPYHYMDFTGCGNTPRMTHPDVLKLIMDSLRYWAREMHVDGFRFDLASTLARGEHGVDRLSSFFEILHQDPVLCSVKLIAEPWDVGAGGYQVGNFPVDWSEWNGRYRDTVRRFWRGDAGQVPDLAYRITGSSDLYYSNGRSPDASFDFLTCHDGFTLHDLVSYNAKHNEANLEDNRDGNDCNFSWNCGVEGETADPAVLELRQRQMRNFFSTLLLSQGIPLITAGDEFARSQGGNNNAYCQDNEISWVDWELRAKNAGLLDFVRRWLDFRRKHPCFRRMRFFEGRKFGLNELKDISWLRPDGREMSGDDWSLDFVRCFGFVIDGKDLRDVDEQGRLLSDSIFLVIFNAHCEAIPFTLPAPLCGSGRWRCLMDTTAGWLAAGRGRRGDPPGSPYPLGGHSLALLEWAEKP
jgi:isoamylase